jgi:hypothetical protein
MDKYGDRVSSIRGDRGIVALRWCSAGGWTIEVAGDKSNLLTNVTKIRYLVQ